MFGKFSFHLYKSNNVSFLYEAEIKLLSFFSEYALLYNMIWNIDLRYIF